MAEPSEEFKREVSMWITKMVDAASSESESPAHFFVITKKIDLTIIIPPLPITRMLVIFIGTNSAGIGVKAYVMGIIMPQCHPFSPVNRVTR
jgi:hypothetical protein